MKLVMNILSSPVKRCLTGFVMMMVPIFCGAIFPPMFFLAFLGAFLFLMLGELEKTEWFETGRAMECGVCNGVYPIRVVKVKHRMHMVIPLPILMQLSKKVQVTYKTTYYAVCTECIRKHVGENNFAVIDAVAKGGLATVKEIGKEGFKALVP